MIKMHLTVRFARPYRGTFPSGTFGRFGIRTRDGNTGYLYFPEARVHELDPSDPCRATIVLFDPENRAAREPVLAHLPEAQALIADPIPSSGSGWHIERLLGLELWFPDQSMPQIELGQMTFHRADPKTMVCRFHPDMLGGLTLFRPDPAPAPLRPCAGRYVQWEGNRPVPVDFPCGWFHQWAAEYEEFEAGPGNFTVALVELPTGEMVTVLPQNLRFLDRPSKGGVPIA